MHLVLAFSTDQVCLGKRLAQWHALSAWPSPLRHISIQAIGAYFTLHPCRIHSNAGCRESDSNWETPALICVSSDAQN